MCYLLSDNNTLSVKNIVLGLWRLTLFQLYRGRLFTFYYYVCSFLWGSCFSIFSFLCVCFVHRCLSYLFWPLCCLFFFDLRILTSPLAFSNSLIGGENRSTRRKAPTCHMSLINFIT